MRAITPEGFEALFRRDIDPWDYAISPFEAFKRSILLHACGTRPFARGLELGCANGETTRALARLCLRLTALDGAPTAVAAARQRLASMPRIRVAHALLPADLPRSAFDLIVVSELLYYLPDLAAARLLRQLVRISAPGGRIVLLHHHTRFDDTTQMPERAQARAAAWLAGRMVRIEARRFGSFSCATFARTRG